MIRKDEALVDINAEQRILVADVGGTNVRFGIAAIGKENIRIIHEQSYLCANHLSFEGALELFLAEAGSSPLFACVAVAGPVIGNSINMTNIPWTFSAAGLQAQFGFSSVMLINDFAAQAFAVPILSGNHLVSIKSGTALDYCTKGILGPGTGLGVASLVYSNSAWFPLSGEGGHVSFPVSTHFEAELFNYLKRQYQLQYVPAEFVLCGSGLVILYRAMAALRGEIPLEYRPEDITSRYDEDVLAEKTLTVFIQLLASAASNLALTVGAQGGIFLAGGILPRIETFLQNGVFTERFCSKGGMSHYLESIPVQLMVHSNPALIGAAACFRQKFKSVYGA